MGCGTSEQDNGRTLVADRIEFLELLAERGPLDTRDIVDTLDYSRSTVTRALSALREAALIEKTQDGYTTTAAAEMAATQYRRYEAATEAILDNRELLAPISEGERPAAEVFVGAQTSSTDSELPIRPLERLTDRIRTADTVTVYLPTLVNTHLLRVCHRAVVGNDCSVTAVATPELLTVLKGQYPQLLAEMAASDSFTAYETDGPSYGLAVVTDGETRAVSLLVYEERAAIRGVVTNDSPRALEWADGTLETLIDGARPVTTELRSLSGIREDEAVDRPPMDVTEPGARDTSPTDSGGLPLALETEGFVQLSSRYFETRDPAPPAISWRTGLRLAEVQAGHAVTRVVEDGTPMAESLLADLQAGRNQVILGPPGSGKSTVCKAVACEWYARELGPVLYREQGRGNTFESAPLLEAFLRQTEEHALVIVEDAVRTQTSEIFSVIEALGGASDVTFLLDARETEWQEAGRHTDTTRRRSIAGTGVSENRLPPFDEQDCERFIDRFEALTDSELSLTPAALRTRLGDDPTPDGPGGHTAGDALIAQHHILRQYEPLAADEAKHPTPLDDAVRTTYEQLTEYDDPVVVRLALLVNLLNAAGVPVAREYLYAVAPTDDYEALETAIQRIEGELLFDPAAGTARETTYRTRHETWSLQFLQRFQTAESQATAQTQFGQCVTDLLSLAANGDQRDRLRRYLGERTPHLHRIDADPTNWADEVAARVFSVGRTRPHLAPLYGETGDSALVLPEVCSTVVTLKQAYWRGLMNKHYGAMDRAEREFETLRSRANRLDDDLELEHGEHTEHSGTVTRSAGTDRDSISAPGTYWQARAATELGAVSRARGRLADAKDQLTEALRRFERIDHHDGRATVLKHLGNVAYKQGQLETAENRYRESRSLFEELGDRRGQATLTHNLGTVARDRGAFDRAKARYEESRAAYREAGDRYREATPLRNLAAVARETGNLQTAREYVEESLSIVTELGDRHGEATARRILGSITHEQGDLATAADHLETGLELYQTVGDRQGKAHTLAELGAVARKQGDTAGARRQLETSIELCQDLGDQHGEATARLERGRVANSQGETAVARDHFARAAAICLDTGTKEAAEALWAVIDSCVATGDEDAAADWCERAIEFANRTDRSDLRSEAATRYREITGQMPPNGANPSE